MMNRCLYCYQEIPTSELKSEAGQSGYHSQCSKKFFGKEIPPEFDFTYDQLTALAESTIKSQKTVTGVQPKLSLGLSKEKGRTDRFTLIGLWGEYILKPQTAHYPNLPENEDLSMHLAELSHIKTANHALFRLKSGELAYLTKRMDRVKGKKLHMEDMCQLTERPTEQKYKGSYEQIAKAIARYSQNPGLDMINFYEVVLFCFLTGNNDMHLKNFSLLKTALGYNLSPAYDLVSSSLVVENDNEELALTLNGKKRRFKQSDFIDSMQKAGLDSKMIENLFGRFKKLIPKWVKFVNVSFLPTEMKDRYQKLIQSRASQINL